MDTWVISGAILAILAGLLVRLWYRIQGQEEQLIALESQHRELISQLELANKLRDSLMRAVPVALLMVDQEKQIVLANPVAELLFGQNLEGQTLIAATRSDVLDELIIQSDAHPKEVLERRVELSNRTVRAILTPIQTEHPLTRLIVFHDETELIRLGRARREMVANISHELRTPITTISLLVDTLLNGALEKGKKARKMLRDIQREVAILTQLVQEMRDLSLIESGQMPVKLMPTNISAMIQEGLQPLLSLAEDKHQTIHIHTEAEMIVLADHQQIERVLRNIVHNAIKFTPQGGHIYITATIADTQEVIVSVQDTGPGISKEALSRIFERFFQENPARGDGTGLGLAIARHIVLAHGGRIWVESLPGQGATFYFSLPLAEDQPTTDLKPAEV
jgi:two-component system phosphate regulon sensor histidine kinase PhoR